MIVVDTSALIAIAKDEPDAPACIAALARERELLISAATLTEALVVAGGAGLADKLADLVGQSGLTVVPLTAARARRAASAYARWGRGNHAARLNLGDSFSYALAEEHDCALLYIGKDFAQTDIASAL